ncbi:MAG: T9SS type A sorting domain-containing protein [Porphyromonas sp.]|nr:T9SS type A sorting domain-containing protein [Porphyromonas sp.]
MKKIYLVAVSLCAFALSAQAQVQRQRVNEAPVASVRAGEDPGTFQYYKDTDDVFYLGDKESSIDLGAFIRVPGKKLEGCTVTGYVFKVGFGNVAAQLQAWKAPEGTDDANKFGEFLNIPYQIPEADKAVLCDVTFDKSKQFLIEGGSDYLFGYYAPAIKGFFLGQTDVNKDPIVPNVNYARWELDDTHAVGFELIDKYHADKLDANWILAVKFVRSTGIEGVYINNGILVYSQNGKVVIEGGEATDLRVFDLRGQELRNEDLASGAYIVSLLIGGRPASFKVVVK